MSDQDKLLFKILSGTHLGVEVLLAPGRYLVGQSEEADLILTDQMIGDTHAWLEISEDNLRIEPIDQALVIHRGQVIRDESLTLRCYEPVTLGTTRVAIGAPGGDWSGVFGIGDSTGGVGGQAATFLRAGTLVQVARQAARRSGLRQRLNTIWPPRRREQAATGRGLMTYVVVGMAIGLAPVVLSLTSGTLVESGNGTVESAQARNLDAVERAHLLLTSSGQADVTVAKSEQGEVVLSGFVADRHERSKVLDTLSRNEVRHDASGLRTQQELLSQVNELLAAMDLSRLQATYLGQGRIEVSGYVAEKSHWEQAEQVLRRDLQFLGPIVARIDTLASRKEALERMVKAAGIDNPVQVARARDGALQVSGMLSAPEMEKWRAVVARFIEKYGEYPRIRSRVDDIGSVLGMEIQGVVISPDASYVILGDGRRYMEGAVTDNGYTIELIEYDRLVLSGRNHRHVLNTGV